MKIVVSYMGLMLLCCLARTQAQDAVTNRVVHAKGFRIELKHCEKAAKAITCSFAVTNEEADRVIFLFDSGGSQGESYLVDSGGMQMMAKRTGRLGSSSRDSMSYAHTEAVTDVAVKGVLEFDVGDPQAASIAKLSIGFESGSSFRAEFKKVPLE